MKSHSKQDLRQELNLGNKNMEKCCQKNEARWDSIQMLEEIIILLDF